MIAARVSALGAGGGSVRAVSIANLSGKRLLLAIAIGAAVGVLSGLLGVGGGALLIVGLVTLGFRQHAAHATSLSAIILIAAAAVVPFALAGEVAPLAAAVLAPTAMAGAYVGAGLMSRIPERWLRGAFVAFILLVALRMLLGVETGEGDAAVTAWEAAGLAGLGVATGALSSVMGVGGGMLLVPAMVLLFDFGQHIAEGTSLAVVIPTALVGAWRHSRTGYTSWGTGTVLGVAGVLGGLGGAQLALLLEGVTLQRVFAVFLVVMAVRLLRESRRQRPPPEPPPDAPPGDTPGDPAH